MDHKKQYLFRCLVLNIKNEAMNLWNDVYFLS